jgi:hypothetical protein
MGPGAMVMSPTGGEIPIYIDPTADPWLKRIVITPNSFPQPVLTPGQVIGVWEKIRILPPPPTSGIPQLPFTDWHEQIVDIVSPIPDIDFGWGGGELIIHGPGDPGSIPPPLPLVVAPGMVDPLDPHGIWFGPWTPVPPIGPNGLPVWIHKQLIYHGPTITIPGTIEIFVREWPTTPEPTTLVLAGLGCIAAVGLRRRRKS